MKRQHMWQRTRRGFTLVELIVVIAILAILAGVAIPVYSGYIKKANQAADEQLLAAVNTAFAAACRENRFDAVDAGSAELRIENDCITGVKNVTVDSAKLTAAERGADGAVTLGARAAMLESVDVSAKVNASFQRYFGTNSATPLRSDPVIEFSEGRFRIAGTGDGSSGGTKTVTFQDSHGVSHTVTVSQADIDVVLSSNFGDASVMSMNELMGEVDKLTDVVSSIDPENTGNGPGKQFVNAVFESAGFQEFLFDAFGVDPEDEDSLIAFGEALDAAMAAGATPSSLNANGLVLYTAIHSTEMDSDALLEALKGGSGLNDFIDYDNMPDALANMSMVYGLCTAYAYKNNLDTSTYSKIMNYAGTEGFLAYLDEDGASDMSAYLSCMNMINENLSNIDVIDVMANGFSDPSLVNMINEVLGR